MRGHILLYKLSFKSFSTWNRFSRCPRFPRNLLLNLVCLALTQPCLSPVPQGTPAQDDLLSPSSFGIHFLTYALVYWPWNSVSVLTFHSAWEKRAKSSLRLHWKEAANLVFFLISVSAVHDPFHVSWTAKCLGLESLFLMLNSQKEQSQAPSRRPASFLGLQSQHVILLLSHSFLKDILCRNMETVPDIILVVV